ncbi:hypothetical protein AURDEDRAFT_143856 [Auricularia subglabra TFB-10046 SS5]|nr:hypothetical protein AURDEDRAFT_143856 [Auricularia subglabra TFB-10046 SS5]
MSSSTPSSSTNTNAIDLNLVSPASSPRVKPPPTRKGLGVPFVYNPSADGTDENLLILLHGRGDTEAPFGKLGKSLNLPQTATLALRGPQRIPWLDEDGFEWYISFDELGYDRANPDPTPALAALSTALAHLTSHCGWAPERVHLFGFAQGGSVAGEFAVRQPAGKQLGSVVSVCGPLLSFPSLKPTKCATRVMLWDRVNAESPKKAADDAVKAWRRGFERVVSETRQGEGMPRNRDEWTPIMAFWSDVLATRAPEGTYSVQRT